MFPLQTAAILDIIIIIQPFWQGKEVRVGSEADHIAKSSDCRNPCCREGNPYEVPRAQGIM